MQYLLDTVAVIYHFAEIDKFGDDAAQLLSNIESTEDSFVISAVSLMEIMYLAEKNRISIDLNKAIDNTIHA